MKKVVLLLVISMMGFGSGCNSSMNNKEGNAIILEETETSEVKTLCYETVESLLAMAEEFSGETVNVSGVIDHVCKHGGKRFKILSSDGATELKIELGDKFDEVDASIVGNNVKVTGTLMSTRLDANMVKAWEERMKDGHKGEENTEHYKEELAEIREIYRQIVSEEIPFYITYSVQADKYELE